MNAQRPTPPCTMELKSGHLLVIDTTTEGVILSLASPTGPELVRLTLPADPSSLASLSIPGLDLNVYRSAMDDRVVLDVLTDMEGVLAHRADEQPLLRVNVNDANVHDPA